MSRRPYPSRPATMPAEVLSLLRSLKRDPAGFQNWIDLAESCRKQRLYRLAEKFIDGAIRLHPGVSHPYSILGNIQAGSGRLAEASAAYQTALRLAPDSLPALRELTGTLIRLGRGGQALRALGDALAKNRAAGAADQIAKIYWEAAAAHGEPGTRNERRAFFLKFLDLPPEERLLGYFRACCMLGRFEESFRSVERMMRPGSVTINFLCDPFASLMPPRFSKELAASLARARVPGKFRTLRSFYLRMWDSDSYGSRESGLQPAGSRYVWMNYVQACAERLRGNCAGALRLLLAIQDKRGGDWLLNCTIGEILLCTGERREAYRQFGAGPGRRFMEHPGAVAWKGEALLFEGRYGEAIKQLTAAIAGGNGLANTWRGAAYFRSGKPGLALEDLDTALNERPKDLEARAWRSEVRRSLGQFDQALEDVNFILDLDPGYVWAYVNRALMLLALGDTAGMERDFRAIENTRLVRLVKNRLGVNSGGKPPAGRIGAILTKALEWSKGNRRTDITLLNISFPESAAA